MGELPHKAKLWSNGIVHKISFGTEDISLVGRSVVPEPEPAPEKDEVDVVVGVRIKAGEESQMRKVKLHVLPTTKVKHILQTANKVLAKLDTTEKMQIEKLVPLWTPTWDDFPHDKNIIEVLKYSFDQNNEPYDAREMDPVRMVGVDADQ